MPGKQKNGFIPLCRRLTRSAAERVGKWKMIWTLRGLSDRCLSARRRTPLMMPTIFYCDLVGMFERGHNSDNPAMQGIHIVRLDQSIYEHIHLLLNR